MRGRTKVMKIPWNHDSKSRTMKGRVETMKGRVETMKFT